MKYSFAVNAFMKWLPANSHRLNAPPCNIQQQTGIITFNLSGITEHLQWEISKTGAFLAVRHPIPFIEDERDDFWDGFADFDIYEEQTASGDFYCTMCDKQYRKYYPTRLALWESHCFENIIEWSNENIIADKLLILDPPSAGGSTSAMLCTPSEWEQHRKKDKEDPFKIIPLQTELLK